MQASASDPAAARKTRPADAAWVASTYFGEGLPWSFLHQMGTEYLTAVRAPLEQIGYTSWLHLAVWLKFILSPPVDSLSTKRRWMVVMQAVLGGGMLVIASISERRDLPLFWTLMAALAVMHSIHDIACDGYYMLGLSEKDQALYVGIRVAAFRAAMILGSGGLVYLAGKTDWRLGFGGAGAVMLLVALGNALFLPRPNEVRRERAPSRPGESLGQRLWNSNFLQAYRTFFSQPQATLVLSFMFAFRLGDIMMFAMSKPLLRDIGVGTAARGILNGVGTGFFIAATMLSGGLIARIGMRRCLIPMIYIQNFAIMLYVLMAALKPGIAGVAAIYVAEQIASGIGSSAHTVFLMQRSKRAFSASHFAFATAIVALASTCSGAFSGHLAARVGYFRYFVIAFVVSVPSLVMVLFVPRDSIETTPA
jgi:MFS transporter, PAT family, beta-lactamase induction signal transducer AmpG